MRTIETYDRFHRHIRAWADGHLDAFVVLGGPGTGKSSAYKQTLGNRKYHEISARYSPIEVYCTLHDAPERPVVFDDISALLVDPNFKDMLKGLCETGKKIVRWKTTTPKLENRSQKFVFTAPVLIVLNSLPKNDPHVMAILDRCDGICFAPTKAEIINHMRRIFPVDQHLIDLLSEPAFTPTLRTLVKARQWAHSSHLDLLEELYSECGVPEPIRILVGIMQSHQQDQWWPEYEQSTGLTARSYRRHKAVAHELLACKSPEACPDVREGV